MNLILICFEYILIYKGVNGFFLISIMNFIKEINLKESGCEVEESECLGNIGVFCFYVGDGVYED